VLARGLPPAAAQETLAMLTVREQVMLSSFTTLGLGGPARRFVEADTEPDLIAEVRAAGRRGEPLLILGGGSNLVIADDGFPGTVVRVVTRGVRRRVRRAAGGRPAAVRLTVAAGEDWDRVVASCVATGLAGVECLSGIPGLAGATPIQNVGAYGQEVAETITGVRVYDRAQDEVADMAPSDCGFGYRTSVFKRDRGGRFIVLRVSFELTASGLSWPVRYAELARSLGVAEGERVPLPDVRAAVLGLRRGKGMVVDPADPDSRSAGSFFTNPVLDDAQFAALRQVVDSHAGPGTRIPQFPAGPGRVKVPAGWLIGQAGFHPGYRGADRLGAGAEGAPAASVAGVARPGGPAGPGGTAGPGGARISAKHTLALVNPGGASTADIVRLAREIRDRVRDSYGVELTPEPTLIGITL
jgi:UDP-N-acetylmuramate dehydrogenase